jgi:hypothetical protein
MLNPVVSGIATWSRQMVLVVDVRVLEGAEMGFPDSEAK